jgi:hypothetical protein
LLPAAAAEAAEFEKDVSGAKLFQGLIGCTSRSDDVAPVQNSRRDWV